PAGNLILHRAKGELGEPPLRRSSEDEQVVVLRLVDDRVDDVPDIHELLLEGNAMGPTHLREARAVPALLLELPVRLNGAEDRNLVQVLLRHQDPVSGSL